VNPDRTQPSDQDELLRQIWNTLKEVRECACGPEVDLQALFLPVVSGFPNCADSVEQLTVQAGSVSAEQVARFVATAALAANFCEMVNPEQLPEQLIYSASTTATGTELFTGELSPEIVSLRLKITEVRSDGPQNISLYPGANQRKFGSVSFVLSNISGGGDYIYIFDPETYVPLPERAKPGRLRILMKRGLSFEVYDTGERL
jgi:hypothetical protein